MAESRVKIKILLSVAVVAVVAVAVALAVMVSTGGTESAPAPSAPSVPAPAFQAPVFFAKPRRRGRGFTRGVPVLPGGEYKIRSRPRGGTVTTGPVSNIGSRTIVFEGRTYHESAGWRTVDGSNKAVNTASSVISALITAATVY
jgi:hypothetical protein